MGETNLVPYRKRLNTMAGTVLAVSNTDFFRADALPRALIATFVFGVITAEGMLAELTPPQVHALTLTVFMDTLKYDAKFAASSVQECINATKPGYHDTMNAIIHRGIDGHLQLQNGDREGLTKNINSILDHFKSK